MKKELGFVYITTDGKVFINEYKANTPHIEVNPTDTIFSNILPHICWL